MRKRIFEIIEIADPDDRASHVYDISMLCIILVSLLPLCTKSDARWTVIAEIVSVTVFIVDYILREITANLKYPEKKHPFLAYPFTPMAVIDLLAILPSFGLLIGGLRMLKMFRLFRTLRVFRALQGLRVFRAFKFFRYSRSLSLIGSVIKSQRDSLITVAALSVGYVLIAAMLIFNVEPDTFDNFFEAIYWACVSLTTVGYGDIYPVSTAGRIVTILSSAVGIAIVALPAGIITAGYMNALREQHEADGKPDVYYSSAQPYLRAVSMDGMKADSSKTEQT